MQLVLVHYYYQIVSVRVNYNFGISRRFFPSDRLFLSWNFVILKRDQIWYVYRIGFSVQRFNVQRSGVQRSGVQGSAQPPAKKTAGLIEKETDERRTSNECILSVLKKI
jgi:hypothetical protein